MRTLRKILLPVVCCLFCMICFMQPASAAGAGGSEILGMTWEEDGKAVVTLTAAENGTLITAMYDADGRFLSAVTKEIFAGTTSASLQMPGSFDGAAWLKVFLADSSFSPLCDAYMVTPHIFARLEETESGKTLHFSTVRPEGEAEWDYWEIHPYTGYEDEGSDMPPWYYDQDIATASFDQTLYPVSTAYWFNAQWNLKTIENMENLHTDSVTSMRHMFNNCEQLDALDVSGWNTARVRDMNSLFYNCQNLKELDVSGWDTSRATDMQYLFASCWNLASLDLRGWDTSNVTDMHAMLSGLTVTEIPGVEEFDTAKVTDMTELFGFDESLTSLDLRGWDVSNVTTMTYMFDSCRNLEKVHVAGWNTGNVADLSYMFSSCWNLTDLAVSDWDVSNVENMRSLFDGCQKLTSLDISRWNTASVNNMSRLFADCREVSELDVTRWNTSAATDMSEMFFGCQSLTSLDLSSWDTSGVTNMRYLFGSCRALTDLDIGGIDTSKVTDMSGMFCALEAITSLDVSGLNTSQVMDMRYMFNGCKALEALDVSTFDTSKVTDMHGMFSICGNLKTIIFGTFDTGSATDMAQMFWGDSKLTSLDLRGFDTSQVTDMEMMFSDCVNLRTLDLSSFDTANVANMKEMFASCWRLGAIYVSDAFVAKSWPNSSNMFNNCYELKGGGGTAYNSGYTMASYAHIDDPIHDPGYFTDIAVTEKVYAVFNYQSSANVLSFYSILPADAHLDEPYVWKVEPYASEDEVPWKSIKDKIKTVTISQIISTGEMSGDIHPTSMAYWFSGCKNLENVSYWGAHIDTGLVTDMRDLFKGCVKLETIDVYGWDTSRVTDMTGMFSGCSSLTTITMKASDYMGNHLFVTDYAAGSGPLFDGCVSLTGQNGTAYDPAHTGIDYARPDDGYPGYFTERE